MDSEVGLTGTKLERGRPKPHPLLRAGEVVGLVLLGIGLASGRFLTGLAGAALIVAAYAAYRLQHPGLPPLRPDEAGSDGAEGGSD